MKFFLASLCTLSVSLSANAETPSDRVSAAATAVPLDPSGRAMAPAVGVVLRERFEDNAKIWLVEPHKVFGPAETARTEELADRARTAVADGRRAYDALELSEAVARLEQAIDLFKQGDRITDLSVFKSALSYLGASLVLSGKAEDGKSRFIELLVLDPDYTPDPFPPSVGKIFEGAARALKARGTGRAEVFSTPQSAALFIDGTYRGVTPVSLESLSTGTHYIRVERTGYAPFHGTLEIVAKKRITQQATLIDLPSGSSFRDLLARATHEISGGGIGNGTQSLLTRMKTQTLVLVAVSQSGQEVTLTGVVFRANPPRRVHSGRSIVAVTSPTFSADVGAFVDQIAAIVTHPAASPPPPKHEIPPPPEVTEVETSAPEGGKFMKLAGWSLVGVGGASVLAGATFAILALTTHNEFKDTSQNSADLDGIRSDGKTQSLIADITLYGGLAIAGVGATLLILDSLSPSQDVLDDSTAVGVAPIRDGVVFSYGGSW